MKLTDKKKVECMRVASQCENSAEYKRKYPAMYNYGIKSRHNWNQDLIFKDGSKIKSINRKIFRQSKYTFEVCQQLASQSETSKEYAIRYGGAYKAGTKSKGNWNHKLVYKGRSMKTELDENKKIDHRKIYGAGYHAGINAAKRENEMLSQAMINESIMQLTTVAKNIYNSMSNKLEIIDVIGIKREVKRLFNLEYDNIKINSGINELISRGLVKESVTGYYIKITAKEGKIMGNPRKKIRNVQDSDLKVIETISSKIDNAKKMEEKNKQKIIDNPEESLVFLVNKIKDEMNDLLTRRFNDLELAAYYIEENMKEKEKSIGKDLEKVKALKALFSE